MVYHALLYAALLVLGIPLLASGAGDAAEAHAIDPVCVDEAATNYATFQSHNQKVVANAHGIFMTHIRTRNEPYTAQQWRLSRSTDGGRTFETIHEATHATNPPVIETDSAGNLYLVRADFEGGGAYLYRFSPDRDFAAPQITTLPGAAAGKYAMRLDEPRKRLYFFSHNNRFFTVGLDGETVERTELLKAGEHAVLQYPHLSLARDGTLHAAWTTQKHGVYLYWDIHHMLSRDGGKTWRTMAGQPLAPPLAADGTGEATRITLDDEFEVHTWLSSFAVWQGKAHFLYLAQHDTPRQHYTRYDIATGQEEQRTQPVFAGESIRLQGLDGFFAIGRERGGLFCVGANGGRLACLASWDHGKTWHDHAQSKREFRLYSIGGYRWTTSEGYIIGSFSDTTGQEELLDRNTRVYFFRIPTRKPL